MADQRNSHIVQFYSDDHDLSEEISRLVGTSLLAGESAILIATAKHREDIEGRLRKRGFSTQPAANEGRFLTLDAADMLDTLSVDGSIERDRFIDLLGTTITQTASKAQSQPPRIVIFGEMVALLMAKGEVDSAILLEKLWNELARTHSFSLCCAYPMNAFSQDAGTDEFSRICAEHSGVIGHQDEAVARNSNARRQPVLLERRLQAIAEQAGSDAEIEKEGLRLLTHVASEHAVMMLDREGCVTLWSRGAETVTGFLAQEVAGKHFSRFYSAEALQWGTPRRHLQTAEREGVFEDEGFRVRKDGSSFWARVTILSLRNAAGAVYGYGQIIRDLSETKKAQTDLDRSEERFRLLVEAVQDYAIFTLDAKGHVTSWNAGAERLKGYKAQEILGQHFSRFYCEEDRKRNRPHELLNLAATEGRTESEGWRVRKDGSKFWANVTITAVRDAAGNLIGFAKVTRDITERKRAQQRLAQSEKSLRLLSVHLLRTQDEERRRIGRDLHDSLGQYLVALKMKLDGLESALAGDAKACGEIKECCRLTEESIREVRTISYLMYPPLLDEVGLKSAIPWYLDGFSQRSGIATAFHISPDFDRLPPDAELAMFRVLQESLTNVHRHSGSPNAEVRLSLQNGSAILEIRDSGKGLPAAGFEQGAEDWAGSPGLGLRGMNERVLQLGGRLEVSSNHSGTTVKAIVPCRQASDGAAQAS